MASRIIHLAIAKCLGEVLQIKYKNRFYIGHILPDAVISADKRKVNSHFIEVFDNGRKKHFDFYAFYERYKDKIPSNELYLGYYFHLIEDNVFRKLLYYDLGLLSRRGEPKLLEDLYSDYHILNGILTEKYALENTLYVPKDFSNEKINDVYSFELCDFIGDINKDLKERRKEKPKYLTSKRIEKYILDCVDICMAEYAALKNVKHHLDRYDFSFDIKN